MTSKRYRRWLMPKGATFRPGGAAVASLVEKLEKEGFLPKGGGVAERPVDAPAKVDSRAERLPAPLTGAWLDDPGRADVVLKWTLRGGGVRAALPGVADYDLAIHLADDYLYPDGVEPIDSTCACGEELGFEWDPEEVVSPFGAASGIFTECEECSRTFDPSTREATLSDPLSGKTTPVWGGAAHRFAIVVGCAPPAIGTAFDPALKALLEETFGRDFHEVAALA